MPAPTRESRRLGRKVNFHISDARTGAGCHMHLICSREDIDGDRDEFIRKFIRPYVDKALSDIASAMDFSLDAKAIKQ